MLPTRSYLRKLHQPIRDDRFYARITPVAVELFAAGFDTYDAFQAMKNEGYVVTEADVANALALWRDESATIEVIRDVGIVA